VTFNDFNCDAHDGYVPGCRACLAAWLDRKPPRTITAVDGADDTDFRYVTWRDFEPERCAVVEAGNGFRAVRVETGAMDLSLKAALCGKVKP
jgi:hypothetical protein